MSDVGINLNTVTSYTDEAPFIDRFKTSKDWGGDFPAGTTVTNKAVPVDAHGYPLAFPTGATSITSSFTVDPVAEEMTDRYVILFKGTGQFSFGGAKVISSEAGRWVVEATVKPGDASVGFTIKSMSATDPVRDIHIVREDQIALFNSGEIFNPAFVEKMANFDTLRFMDWTNTNASDPVTWATRATIDQASWNSGTSPDGVPLEVLVKLANKAQADMWYNVPTTADDTYVRNALSYIRDNLDPSLKVHVEWSNETWNTMFDVAKYASGLGNKIWGKDTNGNGTIDGTEAVARANSIYTGYRAAQVAAIANDVFGSQADARLANVLSSQPLNPGLTPSILKGVAEAKLGAVSALFDEYAVTTYFGGQLAKGDVSAIASKVLGWARGGEAGMAAAFKELEFGGTLSSDNSLKAVMETLKGQAAIASANGLDMVAYEGGAHIYASKYSGADQTLMIDFMSRLMNDPRMGVLYTKMIEGFTAIGGTDLMAFADVNAVGKNGYWGVLDNIYQDGSPRYDALVKAAQADEGAIAAPTMPAGYPAPHVSGALPAATPRVTGARVDDDFNGDGRSDILTSNYQTSIRALVTEGSSFLQKNLMAVADRKWTIVDTLDMNGDGKSDVLLRDASGKIAVWNSTGKKITPDSYTAEAGADRKVVAVGDFTGDGKDDILFAKSDGKIALWASTGKAFDKDVWTVAPAKAGTTVAGSGDFNGDGREDVLWRGSDGAVSLSLSTGSGLSAQTAITGPGAGWTVAGIGDFTRDGTDDVLWRNQAGAIMVWEAHRGVLNAASHADVGLGEGWAVAQVGDFTGDGRADILWRGSNGELSVWAGTETGFTRNAVTMTGMNGATAIVSEGPLFG